MTGDDARGSPGPVALPHRVWAAARSWWGRGWGAGALVALAAALVFARSLGFDFVSLDDPAYGPENPWLHAPPLDFLRWAFTNVDVAHWFPLTWLTLRLDQEEGGGAAWAFHLQNVVWHAANAALVYSLALRLQRRRGRGDQHPGAAVRQVGAAVVAALLFALHPLRVESVAWVTERKDVLYGFCSLAATHAWWSFREATLVGARRRAWAGSLVMLALALMSKPAAVAVPAAWVLLDRWAQAGDDAPRPLGPMVPHLLLAAAAAGWTLLAAEPLVAAETPPLAVRLLVAAHAPAAYAWLTLWPHDLRPLYGYPEGDAFTAWRVGTAAIGVVASAAAVAGWRRAPGAAAAWLAWLVLLSPTSGLVQLGPQEMADRFTYLAAVPVALAAGGGVLAAARARAWAWPAVAAPLLALGLASWAQQDCWRDGLAMWDRVLRYESGKGLAWRGRAIELARRGRTAEALADLDRAIEIATPKPGAPLEGMYLTRAILLGVLGRGEEAQAALRTVSALRAGAAPPAAARGGAPP